MEKFGTVDSPILYSSQDRLFMDSQVKGMAKFMEKCETPMSISIQGSWGSGKTSFVNMVMDQMKKDYGDGAEEDLAFVSFNAWQFVQFNLSDQLCASMITAITKELAKGIKNDPNVKERVERIFNGVEILKATGKLAAILVNGAVKKNTDVDVLSTLDKAGLTDTDKVLRKTEKSVTAVDAIESLRKDLRKTIEARLGIDEDSEKTYSEEELSRKRAVVFVDDLDRLAPDKAIDVLETLKTFFESKHCIFLLAIDQDVIINGVSVKFKNSITEEKGRDFFEKLIQVVYTLPDVMTNVDQYIAYLLSESGENIAFSYEFAELVHATGKENPRAVKRLINSYKMIKMMWSQVHRGGEDRRSLIDMFALLCLQSTCLEFYEVLSSVFSGKCNYSNCIKWFNCIHLFAYEIIHREESDVKVSNTRLRKWNLLKNNEPDRLKIGLILKVLDMVASTEWVGCINRGSSITIDQIIKLRDVIKWTNLISNFSDTHSGLAAVACIKINGRAENLRTGTIDEAYRLSFERMISFLLSDLKDDSLWGRVNWYPEGKGYDKDAFLLATPQQRLEDVVEHFEGVLATEEKNKAGNWKEIPTPIGSVWLNEFADETNLEDRNRLKMRVIQLFAGFYEIDFTWYSDYFQTREFLKQKANKVTDLDVCFHGIPFICVAGEYVHVKSETIEDAYYLTINYALMHLDYEKAIKTVSDDPKLFKTFGMTESSEMEDEDLGFDAEDDFEPAATDDFGDLFGFGGDGDNGEMNDLFAGSQEAADRFWEEEKEHSLADDLEAFDPKARMDVNSNIVNEEEVTLPERQGDWRTMSIASYDSQFDFDVFAGYEPGDDGKMTMMKRAYDFLKSVDVEFTWYADDHMLQPILQFSHADYYSRHLGETYLKRLYKECPQFFMNFS